MEYISLGKTGLQVSVIGLGGEWLNGLAEQETKAIFDVALENGINFLDVFMPQAPTRDHIGAALRGRRNKMIIQGHFCTIYKDGQYKRTRDLEETKASFDDLLKRLGTNYIDIGMIHYIDTEQDYEAVFSTDLIKYIQEQKRKGIIGCIGLSSHNPTIALKAIESGLIDVLMFSINPAYDMEHPDTDYENLREFNGLDESGWMVDHVRQKLYTTCENLGVGITVMKALGSGSLLSKARSPFGVGMTVTQCIHYCMTRPGVQSVFIGYHTVSEVLDSLQYLQATDKEKDYSHIFAGNQNIKMTGRCMYCNHCLPCPAHINIAMVSKFLDLAECQSEVPETVREHYFSMEKNADDCIMCGKCEPNCPFGVNIRENMRRARTVFKKA